MTEDRFPVEDIEASIANKELQRSHDYQEQKPEERARLDDAKAKWFYFRSPPWTWKNLCGREGWIMYDPKRQKQYAFLATLIN